MRGNRGFRRALLIFAAVVLVSAGVVTAAIAAGGEKQPRPAADPGRPQPAPVSVSYAPSATADVPPSTPAAVAVTGGTLADVVLTAADGTTVTGEMSSDKSSWHTTDPLDYGTTYAWSGTANGTGGAPVPLAGTFSTVKAKDVVRGTINIGDDRTVGIAAPVRIQFDDHVSDRAAVERALSVTTSAPVEGSWGWLPDEGGGSRVDWRPKEYWPAYTDVTITAKLFGVAYGGGSYGAADLTSTFSIGRSQIVKADVNSHRMIVVRDGQQVADYAASYGLGSDPERNTRSGLHVVSEKFTDKRMVSERYGYDVMEKWAVRISNNGEFIHANPASAAAQGSSNITHGCVNLSLADAKAYYDTALYGDPVEVTGTPVELSPADGDIADWTYSWPEWQNLSAV